MKVGMLFLLTLVVAVFGAPRTRRDLIGFNRLGNNRLAKTMHEHKTTGASIAYIVCEHFILDGAIDDATRCINTFARKHPKRNTNMTRNRQAMRPRKWRKNWSVLLCWKCFCSFMSEKCFWNVYFYNRIL